MDARDAWAIPPDDCSRSVRTWPLGHIRSLQYPLQYVRLALRRPCNSVQMWQGREPRPAAQSVVGPVDHGVAAAAGDQPAVDGSVTTNAIASDDREAPPEQGVRRPAAIAPGITSRNALSTISIVTIEVVSAASAVRRPARSGMPAGEQRPHRQAVAEGEREDDRQRDRREVVPAEGGRDRETQDLADRAAREAVHRGLEGQAVEARCGRVRMPSSREDTGRSPAGAPRATGYTRPRCCLRATPRSAGSSMARELWLRAAEPEPADGPLVLVAGARHPTDWQAPRLVRRANPASSPGATLRGRRARSHRCAAGHRLLAFPAPAGSRDSVAVLHAGQPTLTGPEGRAPRGPCWPPPGPCGRPQA